LSLIFVGLYSLAFTPSTVHIHSYYLPCYPSSLKSAPFGGTFHFSQYSYTFSSIGHASLPCCCAFCGLAICTISFSLFLFFSTSIFKYSYLRYPIPQHLKHLTPSIVFCLLTFTFSLTLYCITLLAITSNLFWGIDFLFSSTLLFLQLWTRCPNLLHPQYTLPSLLSISALSLTRACYWLSILLRRELYCSRDIMLYITNGHLLICDWLI